jgi:hypothetical protein
MAIRIELHEQIELIELRNRINAEKNKPHAHGLVHLSFKLFFEDISNPKARVISPVLNTVYLSQCAKLLTAINGVNCIYEVKNNAIYYVYPEITRRITANSIGDFNYDFNQAIDDGFQLIGSVRHDEYSVDAIMIRNEYLIHNKE